MLMTDPLDPDNINELYCVDQVTQVVAGTLTMTITDLVNRVVSIGAVSYVFQIDTKQLVAFDMVAIPGPHVHTLDTEDWGIRKFAGGQNNQVLKDFRPILVALFLAAGVNLNVRPRNRFDGQR